MCSEREGRTEEGWKGRRNEKKTLNIEKHDDEDGK